jgi:hypothetical protein
MNFFTNLKIMFNLHSVLSQVNASTFCVDLQFLIYIHTDVYTDGRTEGHGLETRPSLFTS